MGRYRISHQIMEEYLLSVSRDHHRAVAQYRGRRFFAACLVAILFLAAGTWAYVRFFAPVQPEPPKPYDETLARIVLTDAMSAYSEMGHVYANTQELISAAQNGKEAYESVSSLHRSEISTLMYNEEKDALDALELMLAKNEGEYAEKVMPWSLVPMNEYYCRMLLGLPMRRSESYTRYLEILNYLMEDKSAFEHYGARYIELLRELNLCDAQINAGLYQLVLRPHLNIPEEQLPVDLRNLREVFKKNTIQNKLLTGDSEDLTREKLDVLEGRRNRIEQEIWNTGVIAAYEISRGI